MKPEMIERFMRRALVLAGRGEGTTHPNPMVGAVVVAGGKTVGEGWHQKPGEPHAEAIALDEAGRKSRGGTLFVNLEPCDHTGRTPPCTQAIIKAGIARVFAACADPHSLVDGKGFDTLRKAGIEVNVGTLQREAEELNRAFFNFSRKGRPYVTLKLAATLDGRIAGPSGDSKWITGEKARRAVHRLRAQADAVMVGVGTVVSDDPMLTVRGVRRKIQPYRIILDPSLRTPPGSSVVKENSDGSTLLVTGDGVPAERRRVMEKRGVRLIAVPLSKGVIPWSDLADALVKMGILHVLVEGGGKTAAWLLRERAVNRVELFMAPRITGSSGVPAVGDMGVASLQESLCLSILNVRRIGGDVRITADIK